MKMNHAKLTMVRFIPLLILALSLAIALAFNLHHSLSFASLKAHHADFKNMIGTHFIEAVFIYCVTYTLVTATSIPGATFMTMAGGLYFGLCAGAILAVCSATLGASLVFLAARTALADFFYKRVKHRLPKMTKGFQDNALSYLLFLRLVPLFPFFVVNIAPAFFNIHLGTYIFATFLGIIPGTVIYASVGSGLESLIASGQTPDVATMFRKEILLPLLGLGMLSLIPLVWKNMRNGAKT